MPRNVSTQLLYEKVFPIGEAKRHVGVTDHTVRRLIDRGRISRVTGDLVQLECCYLQSNQLATSIEAYRRFLEKLNGAV